MEEDQSSHRKDSAKDNSLGSPANHTWGIYFLRKSKARSKAANPWWWYLSWTLTIPTCTGLANFVAFTNKLWVFLSRDDISGRPAKGPGKGLAIREQQTVQNEHWEEIGRPNYVASCPLLIMSTRWQHTLRSAAESPVILLINRSQLFSTRLFPEGLDAQSRECF